MWKCLTLFIVLTLYRDARGAIGDQMAEVIQLCCDDGSSYARQHQGQECVIASAPANVPHAFGSMCVIAQAQCCKDYVKKSTNCDSGIDLALSSGKCTGTKDSTKVCCEECSRGSTAGLAGGVAACVSRSPGANAEEHLADDAYVQCCKKTAKEGAPTFTPKPESTVASICEEYAPNELCAHHCIPVPGSYKCECNPGFMLMPDGRNCREVVKNRCKPRNPCQHKCNDNGVSVLCTCRRGYQLMADGKSCQDIDECQLDVPVCLPDTKCTNVQGSYRCIHQAAKPAVDAGKGQCPPGFARNLRNNVCDDINECKLPRPPCPAPHCVNTVGGYRCGARAGDPVSLAAARAAAADDRCPPGFAMNEQGECYDVDECALLMNDCNLLSQFCVNTHGSFFCKDIGSKHCRPGFKIDTFTGRCDDINECEDDPLVCRPDQTCVNQLGQYDCKDNGAPRSSPTGNTNRRCPDGMRFNPKIGVCDDVDECVEGTHLCDQHQSCLNTNGSFECHCKIGFERDATTGACVDVNECAKQQHDCVSGSQRCDNTVGSYLCIRITSCGTGYILHHSTGNCEDVDECALGTHNCASAGPEYQCTNLPGSFRCVRKRASTTTTTTTLPPDYEYEYYDSDEETDNPSNSTDTKPKALEPAGSTPNPPPPSTEVAATEKVEPRLELPVPDLPAPDNEQFLSRIDEKVPAEPERKETIPENEHKTVANQNTLEKQNTKDFEPDRKPIDYAPEVPRYVAPLYPPVTTPETKYEEREFANRPEIVYNERTEPKPYKETPDSTYYETRPEKPVSWNEIGNTEESFTERPEPTEAEPEQQKPMEPEEMPNRHYKKQSPVGVPKNPYNAPGQRPTYSPYKPLYDNVPTPPIVLVNAGPETATVPVLVKEDGSVLVDTSHVPKNEWTKINQRSSHCPAGYEASDNGGCFDIDECATNRHSCSGITEVCRNTFGGHVCDCAVGFRRDIVTGACDLIIITTSSTTQLPPTVPTTTPEPTTSSTTKRALFYGYPDDRPLVTRPFRPRAACDAGFQLNHSTGTCEDIDECTNGQANCAAVEICVNTRGGYRCECPPRWWLDPVRHRCVPRAREGFPQGYGNQPDSVEVPQETPASQGPKVNPLIREEENKRVLRCPLGYRLGANNTCLDFNECETGEARCGPQQLCTNLVGGYSCSCPRGHRQRGDHECEDVDECALAGDRPVCSVNADCVNTPGSYQCRCHDGFRPAPANDQLCVDKDECLEAGAHSLCQHRCSNVWGSYRCSCHRGYRLNADNRTCSDIDECVEYKSQFPCVGKCLNEPGSYRCACPIGYRISADKKSCIDIDECETGEATCQTGTSGDTSHVCFNTRGSYRCHRITCPPGYELESKHRCTKADRVCKPGDWDCAHQPTTISFNFITFVSNLFVSEDKVKLFTMRGPAWPFTELSFQLRLVNVNAPPNVKKPADIKSFLLNQSGHEAVISLFHPLQGPQSIELELTMELHNKEQFGGTAVARIFIDVSEYDF